MMSNRYKFQEIGLVKYTNPAVPLGVKVGRLFGVWYITFVLNCNVIGRDPMQLYSELLAVSLLLFHPKLKTVLVVVLFCKV